MTNLNDSDRALRQLAEDQDRQIRRLKSLLFGITCTLAAAIGYTIAGHGY